MRRRRSICPGCPGLIPIDGPRPSSARFLGRNRRSLRDPSLEVGDHRIRQPGGRRHFQLFVAQGLDQQAVRWLVAQDQRAAVATGANAGPAVEQQAPLELARLLGLAGVALVAVLDEYRPDLPFEEFDAGAVRLSRRRGARQNGACQNGACQNGACQYGACQRKEGGQRSGHTNRLRELSAAGRRHKAGRKREGRYQTNLFAGRTANLPLSGNGFL